MRNLCLSLLSFSLGAMLVLGCGDSPSGPEPEDNSPQPSVLQAEFTGGWSPPDTNPICSSASVSGGIPLDMTWEVTATWTICPDSDFVSYELFRSDTAGISEDLSSAILLETYTNPQDTIHVNDFGEWGATYYYAVRTADEDSLYSWSNEVEVSVAPETTFGGPELLIETISVGSGPSSICALPDGDFVYVTCFYDDAVHVIEIDQYEFFYVVAEVAVGGGPVDICSGASGEYVFTADNQDNTVSVIDASVNALETTVSVGATPAGICSSPSSGEIFVACYESDMVYVLDGSGFAVVDSIAVGNGPWDLCAAPGTDHVYVGNRLDGTVSIIDTESHTVIGELSTGQDPKALCPRPGGNRIYVTDGTGNTVYVIDTQLQSVIGSFDAAQSPSGCTALSNGNLVYISCYYSDVIRVYDAGSYQELFILDDGTRQLGLCADPQGRYVYAANSAVGTVSIYAYD